MSAHEVALNFDPPVNSPKTYLLYFYFIIFFKFRTFLKDLFFLLKNTNFILKVCYFN